MSLLPRATDSDTSRARAEHILDVASDLLLRWGYKRVTVDDIAEHADVGKGTIYLHWKTREELFDAVFLREYSTAFEELVERMRQEPQTVLLNRALSYLFLALMRRPLTRAVFMCDIEVWGKLAKSKDQHMQASFRSTLHAYLELLAEHGLLRQDLATDELAYSLRAIVRGFFLTDAIDTGQDDITLEHRAVLMAGALHRAFEPEFAETSEAVKLIAPRVIESFAGIAGAFGGQLQLAYTARRR